MLKTAEFPRKSLQSRDFGHASECLCQVGLQPCEALEIPGGCCAGEIGPRTGTWAQVPCLTGLAGVPWCFGSGHIDFTLGLIVQKQVFVSISTCPAI